MQTAGKANVLLVDDRSENLLALEATLESLGQNLIRANSGEEALKWLLKEEFAVILLDVQMPGLDGFETAALIKEREKSRSIPIIFLTAISKEDQYVFRGYSVGAVDYVFKPFEPNILRSKVAVFVDLYQKNQQIRVQAEILRQLEKREREREVAELKRVSRDRYRNLAEAIPQIVWTARPDGRLEYHNQRWVDYTGLNLEQSKGWGWERVMHPDDLPLHRERWQHSLQTGQPCEIEGRLKQGNTGIYRWHLIRALPERDQNGKILAWLGTCTDIEEQRQATETLKRQNQELELQRQQIYAQNLKLREATQLKSQFLASMSHELRTPLNAIIGFSDLLLRQRYDTLSAQQVDMLQRILNNGRHLLTLINDVLDISKIEAGRLELRLEEVNLAELVAATTHELRSLADQKSLVLQVHCELRNPRIFNDSARLRQVVINLLSNAIKFTEVGSVRIEVSEMGENQLCLLVKDTGIGISPDNLDHIFEAFRQVDQSSTRKHGGTGLGLAISQRLVQMMGGTIRVESQLDRGSTFRVELPRRLNSQVPATGYLTPNPPESRSAPVSTSKTVLLIDNNPDFQHLLSVWLADSGYTLLSAPTGEEGLLLARQHQPAAIILDVILPQMDGWQVLYQLKADSRTQTIPVIVQSVCDSRELGYRLGAADYIVKPVCQEQVLATLATWGIQLQSKAEAVTEQEVG
ncbi:response regulator [Leptolyngbya sp. FACHB-261]|uniref:response regulator n=1 Tax=Leptolyngbya sp. FACHB-261 TaxID=2692806 RepID=UPI001684FD11|nr:response regulator [Leptolyngbya sp. FACHB-261]MBD2101478.1 response regulator [Leptolyngbya sp. FACHB-261]